MKVKQLLEAKLEPKQIDRLCAQAKEGNRLVAGGKTIWGGLGNTQGGDFGVINDMLEEKWKKSGANLRKKLETIDGPVSVLYYSGGRWVPVGREWQ